MKSVTIYTSPVCPYCDRAKNLLQSIGVSYEEHNVIEQPELRQQMAEKYNWMTVPMIVIGDEFIGGYDDMAALQAEGRLMEKLAE